MAHGFLKQEAGFLVLSAGSDPKGVDPRAVKVMAEIGIDISDQTSNHIDEYKELDFDFVITLCNQAKERCPFLPTTGVDLDMNFPDPGSARGSEVDVLQEFRSVRDQIDVYCKAVREAYGSAGMAKGRTGRK